MLRVAAVVSAELHRPARAERAGDLSFEIDREQDAAPFGRSMRGEDEDQEKGKEEPGHHA
jgi:hypothetical protein